jgi:hypothetical protein
VTLSFDDLPEKPEGEELVTMPAGVWESEIDTAREAARALELKLVRAAPTFSPHTTLHRCK